MGCEVCGSFEWDRYAQANFFPIARLCTKCIRALELSKDRDVVDAAKAQVLALAKRLAIQVMIEGYAASGAINAGFVEQFQIAMLDNEEACTRYIEAVDAWIVRNKTKEGFLTPSGGSAATSPGEGSR